MTDCDLYKFGPGFTVRFKPDTGKRNNGGEKNRYARANMIFASRAYEVKLSYGKAVKDKRGKISYYVRAYYVIRGSNY